MSRKNAPTVAEEPDHDLLKHIRGLGLTSVEDYRDWCSRNGFSRKLKKHVRERCRERNFSQEAVAGERLRRRKRERRNHAEVLQAVCTGELKEKDVTLPHLKRLCQFLKPVRGSQQVNRSVLLDMLTHLHHCRSKFFDGSPAIADWGQRPGNTYVEAIALMASCARSWLRPVEAWKPRSHSVARQFASLLRHLFARYDDIPAFFDSVWFTGGTNDGAERRQWYLQVGRGQNIRKCTLPVSLTKKMAHHFMHAPDDVTVEQALRWGQVYGLGGDERLARAIFGTRLAEHFGDEEFWLTVLRWFASHPLLDRSHVGPIVDYIYHQRFALDYVYVAPGRQEWVEPPQPNLSMKGRTPEAMLRRVHEWHRSLESDNRIQLRQWQSCGIEGFEYVEGSPKNGTAKCWRIRELRSSKALMAEGRQMKHCVATYASSCARGLCSIWTMEVESAEGYAKAVTIEVRNNARWICQVRGKANRLPTEKERRILQRWAESAGLRIASFV